MPRASIFPSWDFAGRRTMRATRRALRCRKRAILAPRGEREKRRRLSRCALPKAAIARSAICKQSKAAPRSPTGRFRTATLRGAASVMNRLKFSDIVPQAAQRQLKAPGKASFPFVSVHYFEKTPIYLPQRAQERLGANGTVQYRRKLSDSLPCRERRARRKLQMP